MEYDINTSAGKLRVRQKKESEDWPTIILLHDSLGSIKQWRDFPDRLGTSVNCNVIVYDRQGHGRSDPFLHNKRELFYMEDEARILNEVMDICDLEKAILFGHSDGGTIALIFGALYPERSIAIIAEAAHIFAEDITIAAIKDATDSYRKSGLRHKLEKYHGKKTDTLFKAWSDTWLSKEFRDWNIVSLLPKIVCPVMAIQGDRDEYGTIRQVNGILENVSGKAAGFVIPAIGHIPHREVPEVVLEKARRFINA